MVSKLILSCTAIIAVSFVCPSSQAQDLYAFQFGYSLGYQNSFRNRLPAPPYFAVYPPVYYGKRFERPYGDSPYASFPQLRSAPNYYPVPKEPPVLSNTTVVNPHMEPSSVKVHGQPVAVVPTRVNRTIEIINPFASDLLAGKP